MAVPFAAGLEQDNFALIQEAKLRQRVQGEEEDAASYYYDILHMCHAVNPNMPQTQQLDFLYGVLHKSLVKKIYPLKPTTCKEFLELLKLHTEASLLLDRRAWTEKSRLSASPSDPQTVAVVRQEQSAWTNTIDLGTVLAGLPDSLNDLKNASTQKKVTFGATPLNQRAAEGRLVCYNCSRNGHYARNCFSNPQSHSFRGGRQGGPYRPATGGPPQGRLPVNYVGNGSFQEENGPPQPSPNPPSEFQHHPAQLSEQDQRQWRVNNLSFQQEALIASIPLCMLNSSKLITETVHCGSMVVKAVVDTGAVITVISPKLLKCTQFTLESWHGPNIVLVNGATVSPIGAAYITVTLHTKIAMGTALVMQMEDIDLLLGNDFLKQFGKLHIDYQASKTLITVGDLPLNLIEPQTMDLAKSRKIQTTEGVNIPAFSIRHVPIVSPSGSETQLFTPSRRLILNKALTVGHALLPAQATTVPIANISGQEVWLAKGSTLGTSQNYNKQVISCELDKAVPLPAVPDSTDDAQLRFCEELEQAINTDLSEEDRMTLKDMLKHHMPCFASNSNEVGRCTVSEKGHNQFNEDLIPALGRLGKLCKPRWATC